MSERLGDKGYGYKVLETRAALIMAVWMYFFILFGAAKHSGIIMSLGAVGIVAWYLYCRSVARRLGIPFK